MTRRALGFERAAVGLAVLAFGLAAGRSAGASPVRSSSSVSGRWLKEPGPRRASSGSVTDDFGWRSQSQRVRAVAAPVNNDRLESDGQADIRGDRLA